MCEQKTLERNGDVVQLDRSEVNRRQQACNFNYCSLKPIQPRELGKNVFGDRLEVIVSLDNKWVNGTVLHYYFFDSRTDWATSEAEKNIVREAFDIWKDVGIGLDFQEVDNPEDAEVRIGFLRGDGAWSYLGRAILDFPSNERTMNFGWDLTRTPNGIDTALHEIGHTLGLPHEHQNPFAGIVWNEDAVYDQLGDFPNFWDRDKTYYNIVRKINPDSVQGSDWDPDSIMHYPFEPGMILEPEEFRNGLRPEGGLSERDKLWVKSFYPPLQRNDFVELNPFESHMLDLKSGEQRNFLIEPQSTRYYDMRTFGESDVVMVLNEDLDGEERYLTADDDSGNDENAHIRIKLFRGDRYILKVRMYYAPGDVSLMLW